MVFSLCDVRRCRPDAPWDGAGPEFSTSSSGIRHESMAKYRRWRNRHADNQALGELVKRANVPDAALALEASDELLDGDGGERRGLDRAASGQGHGHPGDRLLVGRLDDVQEVVVAEQG